MNNLMDGVRVLREYNMVELRSKCVFCGARESRELWERYYCGCGGGYERGYGGPVLSTAKGFGGRARLVQSWW
jgi:hypothetical protein